MSTQQDHHIFPVSDDASSNSSADEELSELLWKDPTILNDEGTDGGRHFVDKLLEKLLTHALPPVSQSDEVKKLASRMDDPIRQDQQALSMRQLASTANSLTVRLSSIFAAQFAFLRVLRWSNPPQTVCVLLFYTLAVSKPVVLMLLPLLILCYCALVPGYLYRHPIEKVRLARVRDRGESLLVRFTRVKDAAVALRLEEETIREEEETSVRIPDVNEAIDANVKMIKKNMEFVLNLRDLQNSLGKIVKVLDSAEKFWYCTAGFKDERSSTSMFFAVFLSMIVLIVLGPYIPWRLLLLVTGWGSIISMHPNIMPVIHEFSQSMRSQRQELDKLMKESERKDIVIDEPPQVEQVEIFEIFRKSISSSFEFFCFANTPFDETDDSRKANKPPPSVSKVEQINPPKGWKFEKTGWIIDYNASDWCAAKDLPLDGAHYIDANDEFYIDGQFKRRRLYRNVLRYSRPARKPAHML